jgi:carbon-monoxide dehydrogenase medium subunit
MKPFTYVRPRSVAEATAALQVHGAAARVIAGGQSLLLAMKERLERPSALVSLRNVPEVRGVSYEEDGTLAVGAATTYWELQTADLRPGSHSLLAVVAADVADVPVQRMGTVGGALCQADPTFDFPLAAVAADAEVELASTSGTRRLPASEFLQGPYKTSLAEGEVLTTIRFPAGDTGARCAFVKHRLRRFDPAIVSVACILSVGVDGRVESARVACGAVGPVPIRATAAEELVTGKVVSDEIARQAGEQAAEGIDFMAGSMVFPPEYKRDVLPALVARALRAAFANGKE